MFPCTPPYLGFYVDSPPSFEKLKGCLSPQAPSNRLDTEEDALVCLCSHRKARLCWRYILLRINPFPATAKNKPVQTDNVNVTGDQTSGSGRGACSGGRRGVRAGLSLRVTGSPAAPGPSSPPDPVAWGSRGAPKPPGWHSQLAPSVPLKSPRHDLGAGRRSRVTHVSSKCCSKVASISPGTPQESLPLRRRPPALLDHMTQAGCGLGRRLRRAKLRGATSASVQSARSVPAPALGLGAAARAGLRPEPGGARCPPQERGLPLVVRALVPDWSLCFREVTFGFRVNRLRNVGGPLY